jgi:hypothetical protein
LGTIPISPLPNIRDYFATNFQGVFDTAAGYNDYGMFKSTLEDFKNAVGETGLKDRVRLAATVQY